MGRGCQEEQALLAGLPVKTVFNLVVEMYLTVVRRIKWVPSGVQARCEASKKAHGSEEDLIAKLGPQHFSVDSNFSLQIEA